VGLSVASVVVPTFNERDNVTGLYRKLVAAPAAIAWEVIFVDDNSPDGTWDAIRGFAPRIPARAASVVLAGAGYPGPASQASSPAADLTLR
jgi:Glycosyl transferase family 2